MPAVFGLLLQIPHNSFTSIQKGKEHQMVLRLKLFFLQITHVHCRETF